MFETVLGFLLTFALIWWALSYFVERARREAILAVADKKLAAAEANQWANAPRIGKPFEHCSIRCVVVAHGWEHGMRWNHGVVAHYATHRGEIRELHLTRAQWEAIQEPVGGPGL